MLSDIVRHWPPQPGDAHVGFKTCLRRFTQDTAEVFESLADLHSPAWWTGMKLVAENGAVQRFQISVVYENSARLLFNIDAHEWVQETNQWVPFPWPLPAEMSRRMNIQIIIRSLENIQPQYISVQLSFQELAESTSRSNYLFTELRSVLHYWNGVQQRGGEFFPDDPPDFVHVYTIVPCMKRLIDPSVIWNNASMRFHASQYE
jgi:hypothetical protein